MRTRHAILGVTVAVTMLLAGGCGDQPGSPSAVGGSTGPDPAGATTRPPSSMVPVHGVAVTASWRLAAGGTPALKHLTGQGAARLARAVNALKVALEAPHTCPTSATRAAPMVLRFSSGGHSWTVRMTRCAPYEVRTGTGEVITVAGTAAFRSTLRELVGWVPGESAGGGVMTPLTRSGN